MRGLFAGLCCLVPALVESLSIASIPSVELWLDLRESLLDPAYTLRELEANVPGPRSVPLVAGLVVWYASLGDAAEACGLPIIAVDVGDAELALQLFEPASDAYDQGGAPMVAASRGVKAPSAIQPPYDANAAVAALKPGSCLVVDSRPNRFLDETLPSDPAPGLVPPRACLPTSPSDRLVELLAAAAGSSARLLIACERSNLAACCQALILGDAVGSTSLLGGGAAADVRSRQRARPSRRRRKTPRVGGRGGYDEHMCIPSHRGMPPRRQKERTKKERRPATPSDDRETGLGLVLRPEPRLWTEALDFQ